MAETLSIYQLCYSFKSQPSSAVPSTKSKNDISQRYQLPGSGRIAFGKIVEDRPLFKPSSSVNPTNKPQASTDNLENKFSTLGIIGSSEQASKAQSQVMDVDTNSNSTPAVPKKPSVSTNNNQQQRVNNKRPPPTSQAATSRPAPTKPHVTGNPYLPPGGGKAPSNNPKQSLPNAGQSGKLAAMARLKALGEDWPEEEELPGMAMPNSSYLNSATYSRETSNATQRQRKIQSAKRQV
eukprot:gene376-409_t